MVFVSLCPLRSYAAIVSRKSEGSCPAIPHIKKNQNLR